MCNYFLSCDNEDEIFSIKQFNFDENEGDLLDVIEKIADFLRGIGYTNDTIMRTFEEYCEEFE